MSWNIGASQTDGWDIGASQTAATSAATVSYIGQLMMVFS